MELICDTNGVREATSQSSLSNPDKWLMDALTYGRESDTGVSINWRNAMGLSAAWYCVNTISGDIGQLPIDLYERVAETSKQDRTHPAGKVLRCPQLGDIGAFQFRNLLQNHALVEGNGRAFIVRSGRREPAAFVPLPADRTSTVMIYNKETDIKEKWHVIFPESGEPIPLPDSDVLHIFRFSWNGYYGHPVLDLLKNSFGLGIAGDKHAARFYKNSGVPSFLLESPPGMFNKEEDAQAFLDRFNRYHAGLENSQRVGLIRNGMKANVLGINNQQAQMLENRDFQVRDIMRVFGMPMIPGIADSQSYNTLEQLNRAYLLHCLGPWQRVWEEECGRKLLTESEKRKEAYYFMFDSWSLLKPDAAQEADMLTKYVQGMIIESNEARETLGYAPHKDGSGLRNPATTPGTTTGNPPAKEEKPPEQRHNPPATQRETELIAAKLRPLVSAEVRRVNEMAGKARNFMDWQESFYNKHETRFTEAIVSVGGEVWMAAEYIEHSKYLLTEAAGTSQQSEFSVKVESITSAWLTRADELAATITLRSQG